MNIRYLRSSLFAVLISFLVSCAPGPPAITTATITTTAARVPNFKHIFVVVLENKEYDQVVGQDQTPYFNSLAQHYGLASNYYGIRHPSLPNYLALTGGSTFNIKSDCIDCFVAQPNIVDQLEAAGKSWKAYIESMPSACFLGDAPPLYKQKHNPFVYYNDIRTNPERCQQVVPFTEFAKDLANNALPNYVWITPNLCNDSHDCPTSSSDRWLATWVPQILESPAWQDDGALFITYDEGDAKQLFPGSCCREGNGGHIATLVISPLGEPGYRSPVAYDHYSLLRTIENAWQLPELGAAACSCAPPMADFFVSHGAAQR
jgi:phospholipase C